MFDWVLNTKLAAWYWLSSNKKQHLYNKWYPSSLHKFCWTIFIIFVEAITLGLLDPSTRSLISVILQIQLHVTCSATSFFCLLFSIFFFVLVNWSVVKYSTVLNVLLTWQRNVTVDHCRDLTNSFFTWSMVTFLSTYQPNSSFIVVIVRCSMQYERYLPLGNNRGKHLAILRKTTCDNYLMFKCWHKLSALMIDLFSNVLYSFEYLIFPNILLLLRTCIC